VQAFGPDFFQRSAGAGARTRRPVFIFGLPRSGTTLLEQVLASHPQVYGAGELTLTRRSFESIPTILGLSGPPIECVPHLQADSLRRLGEQHEAWLCEYVAYRSSQQGTASATPERVVDKMPDNYLYLGLLAAMFPQGVG
jgi:Sulfotransferase family